MSDATRRPRGEFAPAVLAVVAVGGGLGALARYGVGLLMPTEPGGFPWSTFVINVSGSLLIGVLMAAVTAGRTGPLVRPFLGVGVLGGYTTFSGHALNLTHLLRDGAAFTAAGYLAATVVGALGATAVGLAATRAVLR